MADQQNSITGYRQLSEAEIGLINEIKAHAEATRELVEKVARFADERGRSPDAPLHSAVTEPMRWAGIARTDLQQGFMALVRAVAQPTTF